MPGDTTKAQGGEASTSVAEEPKKSRRRAFWPGPSSYAGHWQMLSLDELETICHIIYYTPPPHAIHLGCLFDLLKVRRRTEEAAVYVRDAVNSPFDQRQHSAAVQLSKLKKACSKLSEAYNTDDYACAVAVEKKGILDDAAAKVLRKEPDNLAAKYVHFFSEQVYSMRDKSGEALDVLECVINGCASGTAGAYKTRAALLGLLNKPDEMMIDLATALETHKKTIERGQQAPTPAKGKSLEESEMPEGLRSKILVQRGLQYLFMACRAAMMGFAPADEYSEEQRVESQRLAWSQARNALRDIKDFLATLQYSPNWPFKMSMEMHELIMQVPNAKWPKTLIRRSRARPSVEYSMYPVSRLFEARPPDDLPEFLPSDPLPAAPPPPPPPPPYVLDETPGTTSGSVSREKLDDPASSGADTAKAAQQEPGCEKCEGCEVVTYHPYLVEALHGLLLCHCLLQTSSKVIQRHAYMVARLTSLTDGFPLFDARFDEPQTRCYSDVWRYLTLQPESITGLLPLSARWPELCKPKSSKGIAPGNRQPEKASLEADRSFVASATWTARVLLHWLQEKPVIGGVKKVKRRRNVTVPVPAEISQAAPEDRTAPEQDNGKQ